MKVICLTTFRERNTKKYFNYDEIKVRLLVIIISMQITLLFEYVHFTYVLLWFGC